MQNLFLSFLFFFLSSCTPKKLASSSYTNRRILHEPFVPLDTLSPSEPPKPPPLTPAPSTQNPKHPLSTTPTTSTTSTSASSSTIPTNQNPSPFFPNYPSLSSPPPPSPLAFASFPANISALILPHSPKPNSSHNKLLPVALAAVACAVVVVAISAFFYLRRRRRNFHSDAGDKILASDGTVRRNAVGRREQRHAPSASAEFLYLGTVVNSCVIDDGVGVDSGDSIARKMESPELRPLPPLVRQPSLPLPREYAGSATTAEEEEEEFYSPRGSSLGGSGGTESVSRRVFAENSTRRSGTSSSCSFSSSVPGSPEQCHSIILSPPMSSSPRRTQQKSPETAHIPNQHTQSSPSTSSFCSSCSNSPLTLSPNRASEKNRDEALSACTNASSSSEERISEKHEAALSSPSPPSPPARLSNASDGNRNSVSSSAFSLPSSPEKVMNNHILDQSPRISSFSDRVRLPELSSLPLSPTLLSSPEIERGFNFNRTSKESVTPQRKHWEIPGLAAFVPPSPPPPPAPPTLQRQRKHWEVQGPSTPVSQPISRPPELVPPSRPFVLQNPATNVSPVELPPNLGEVEESLKPKLKPLHWDKVRTNSDCEMVWDQLKSSSFKLNEEMIETLFVAPNPKPKDATLHTVLPNQEERVLDPKKSQNIAILLRALNVTIEEVCEALLEGSTDTLGTELLETFLKMAPSKEEERKLKEHKDDAPTKLDLAEKFLKAVLDVPFAFKRVEAMLYVVNFESEVEYLRKSFQTLEAASEELRNCRMFLKLLEAVLKTGNRMNVGTNRGDAEAFKLDTLLKLADVKGADGKTTLLHFVVQEIIRTEGARLSGTNQTPSSTLIEDAKCRRLGLQVVSNLSSELANVKKAAAMDSEILSSEVLKLSKGIANIAAVVQLNQTAGSDENTKKFTESMNKFIKMAEEEIPKIQAQERVAMSLVKEVTEYFHGNLVKEEAHPFRIFMVVRDFLAVLDRVCKEVGMINERTMVSSAHKFPVPVNPMLSQRQQPCNNYDSSDDDSESP